jgi:hypothetical protein
LQNPRCKRAAHIVVMLYALLATLRADYKDDIGYTKLALELGASLPTGIGIGVTQGEASSTLTPPRDYLPDTAVSEFAGKTFTPLSGSGTANGHATAVAQYYYGSATSVAPGVTDIHNYEANDWIDGASPTGFLHIVTTSAPNTETQAVENHSWIGSFTNKDGTENVAANVDALRRFDYAIQQSDFLGVVALNNGNNNGIGNNVPALLASCYNGISVGLSNGNHSFGTNTADGAGRTKPEIVAPAGATSYSTPMVASAAAMLRQIATGNAVKSVTMKAILMAGATKDQFPGWSRSTTHPLDAVYGAGQVNVYSSHHILAAGQQAASTSATVNRLGWDWNSTTTGSRLYFLDLPAGGPSSISVILTWNRTITDTIPGPSWGSPSSSLANLTLKLYAASGFSVGALVDSSTSTVDNVEHVWQPALSAGRYAIEVTADTANINYGLAWYSVPAVTVAATTPTAAERGAVPGVFTITRGGDTTAALTVSYAITGTATNGTDYTSIPATVTIPSGENSATVTVTPIPDTLAEGDETVILTLSGDAAYSFGAQTSATVTIHDAPIDAWRFSKFTAAELADSSLSGDLADFEKDGIVNLFEYAFGLEPKIPDASGLPEVLIQPGGALAITYTHVKSAVDITCTVEVSNDLATWYSGPAYTAVVSTTDHGATESVKVGSLLAPDPSGRQFMRVRITRP